MPWCRKAALDFFLSRGGKWKNGMKCGANFQPAAQLYTQHQIINKLTDIYVQSKFSYINFFQTFMNTFDLDIFFIYAATLTFLCIFMAMCACVSVWDWIVSVCTPVCVCSCKLTGALRKKVVQFSLFFSSVFVLSKKCVKADTHRSHQACRRNNNRMDFYSIAVCVWMRLNNKQSEFGALLLSFTNSIRAHRNSN